jgi:hypothetical protein
VGVRLRRRKGGYRAVGLNACFSHHLAEWALMRVHVRSPNYFFRSSK